MARSPSARPSSSRSARKIRRPLQRSRPGRVCRSAADSFALFARFEAKLEQYRGNLERSAGRARQGLAHRPRAAPARGDAHRARQEDRRSCSRAPAISSSPTTASSRSDRAARMRWRPRRRWRGTPTLDARDDRRGGDDDRRRICIYTNANDHDRRAVAGCPSICPESHRDRPSTR